MEPKQLLTRAAAFTLAALSIVPVTRGAPLRLAWSPSPDPFVAGYYVWYSTNVNSYANSIDVEGSNIVTIPALAPNSTYYITVTAHDIDGFQSSPANEVIYSTVVVTPPTIQAGGISYTTLGQTTAGVSIGAGASYTVAPGASVTFSPTVVAAPPVLCSWYFNGKPMSGATNLTYTIPSATSFNAGSYQLSVTNSTGSAISSPMTLQVVPLLAGTYDGLFYQTNANGSTNINVASAGMIFNWVIGSQGAYSGKICVNNSSFALSGAFDLYGDCSATVSRASAGQSNLVLFLHLNSALAAAQLTGYISNTDRSNPWVASVVADSAAPYTLPASVTVALTPAPGIYPNSTVFTAVNYNGECYVLGALPEGSAFVALVPLSAANRVPIYATLYHGLGLIEGWMQFSSATPSGNLTWVQDAIVGAPYPAGFTNVMTIKP